jgi:hypothetical protein
MIWKWEKKHSGWEMRYVCHCGQINCAVPCQNCGCSRKVISEVGRYEWDELTGPFTWLFNPKNRKWVAWESCKGDD